MGRAGALMDGVESLRKLVDAGRTLSVEIDAKSVRVRCSGSRATVTEPMRAHDCLEEALSEALSRAGEKFRALAADKSRAAIAREKALEGAIRETQLRHGVPRV